MGIEWNVYFRIRVFVPVQYRATTFFPVNPRYGFIVHFIVLYCSVGGATNGAAFAFQLTGQRDRFRPYSLLFFGCFDYRVDLWICLLFELFDQRG